jgi:class 3 adenylate cyclase
MLRKTLASSHRIPWLSRRSVLCAARSASTLSGAVWIERRNGREALSAERVERRLAAILAADVAGYSRLMGRDEAVTLARLKALRREPRRRDPRRT